MAGLARQASHLQRKLSLDQGHDRPAEAPEASSTSTQQLFQKIEAAMSAPIGPGANRSDGEYIPPPAGFLPHAASMPVPRSFMPRNTSAPTARDWPSFGTSYTTSTDADSASASLSPTRFSFFSRRPLRNSTSARDSAESRGVSMDANGDYPDTDRFAHSQPIPIAHNTLAHRGDVAETAPEDIAMYDVTDRREDDLKASFREWHDCVYSASSL